MLVSACVIARDEEAARNLRLARAEVDEPSTGDHGVALVMLGRASSTSVLELPAGAARRRQRLANEQLFVERWDERFGGGAGAGRLS